MAQLYETPHQCDLEVAAYIAARNWQDWRNCFEARPDELPELLLEDQNRFRRFVRGYQLLQYVSAENRERLRIWMTEDRRFERLIDEENGAGVEFLAHEMKENIDFKRERSFLSKVAAFARPDVFMAYDSYARKGLVELGVVPREPGEYVAYLGAVQRLYRDIEEDLEEHLGDRIFPTGNGVAFRLRVLDVYLMMSGGRVFDVKSGRLLAGLKCDPPELRLF